MKDKESASPTSKTRTQVIVDCAESNVSFYEKNGFKRKCCSMSRYFQGNQPADQLLAKHFAFQVRV